MYQSTLLLSAMTNSPVYSARLTCPYVWGDPQWAPDVPVDFTDLIVALANNDEARLRLALIPLFLRYPSIAPQAESAGAQLSGDALVVLRCYYTAAYFLQQMYRPQLERLFDSFRPLPDLFSVPLGLSTESVPKAGLSALAARHRALSGCAINWLGTYQHGAERFISYMEKRKGWQRSQSTTSARF